MFHQIGSFKTKNGTFLYMERVVYFKVIIRYWTDWTRMEVPLDPGYCGWQKPNEWRGGRKRRNKFAHAHGGAEIGPQSLHGLRTIAVGIASLCTLFLPSVLLFCTFSGSFRHSSPSFFLSLLFLSFFYYLIGLPTLRRFHSYSPCCIFKSMVFSLCHEFVNDASKMCKIILKCDDKNDFREIFHIYIYLNCRNIK